MNADKAELMYGAISTLNSQPQKVIDKFANLCSNISSTESDGNIHIGKAWNAIEMLLPG